MIVPFVVGSACIVDSDPAVNDGVIRSLFQSFVGAAISQSLARALHGIA
jgi:hypothetical protein